MASHKTSELRLESKELVSNNSKCKNQKPHILVLGPGGVKGFLQLGLLYVLLDNKYLDDVHTYIGVSIGSIISLLIICNYTIEEIITHAIHIEIFEKTNLFNISSFGEIRNRFTEGINHAGIFSNDIIKNKLKALLIHKFGLVPTLSQLYQFTGKRLICVTNNLTIRKAEYICYISHPNISILDAILLSINIPGLLFKIVHNNHVYCDGALADPYPVKLLDDGKTPILGVYMEESRGIDVDGSSLAYLNQSMLSPLLHLRRNSIKTSSKMVKHICLQSDIIDSSGITVDILAKGRMIGIGMSIGSKFINSLNGDEDFKDVYLKSVDSSVDSSYQLKSQFVLADSLYQQTYDKSYSPQYLYESSNISSYSFPCTLDY